MTGLLPHLPPGEGRGEGDRKPYPTVTRVRALRRDATPAERKLWPLLRNGALHGAKFRRQHPHGVYVLDFAAVAVRLAVELDGDTHATGHGPARDARRTAWLHAKGWHVIRFSNRDVFENAEGVLQSIHQAYAAVVASGSLPRWREGVGVRVVEGLARREPAPLPSPNPLPQAGEGFSTEREG